MSYLVIYLIGINVLTFLIYAIDKWKARRGKWRIPEDTLIWLAIAGGSIGALLGMYLSSVTRPSTANSPSASPSSSSSNPPWPTTSYSDNRNRSPA